MFLSRLMPRIRVLMPLLALILSWGLPGYSSYVIKGPLFAMEAEDVPLFPFQPDKEAWLLAKEGKADVAFKKYLEMSERAQDLNDHILNHVYLLYSRHRGGLIKNEPACLRQLCVSIDRALEGEQRGLE